MLEKDLVNRCIELIRKRGNCIEIKREIPFLSRCIDVVYINSDDEIISIEFKVKDLSCAIKQARNHKLGADKSYICIPKRRVGEKLENEIKQENLGLLFFDDSKDEIIEEIPAPTLKTNIGIFKNLLLSNFSKL